MDLCLALGCRMGILQGSNCGLYASPEWRRAVMISYAWAVIAFMSFVTDESLVLWWSADVITERPTTCT